MNRLLAQRTTQRASTKLGRLLSESRLVRFLRDPGARAPFDLAEPPAASSAFARTASIAAATARRFLHDLELSYQVLLLPPYVRNAEKRLARMPKVHFLDPGIWRAVLQQSGPLSGEAFESAIVAIEIKPTTRAVNANARSLRGLAELLDKPLLAALLLTLDREPRVLTGGVQALPIAAVLGAAG